MDRSVDSNYHVKLTWMREVCNFLDSMPIALDETRCPFHANYPFKIGEKLGKDVVVWVFIDGHNWMFYDYVDRVEWGDEVVLEYEDISLQDVETMVVAREIESKLKDWLDQHEIHPGRTQKQVKEHFEKRDRDS